MQPEHLLWEPNPALRLSCLWSYYREHFRTQLSWDDNHGYLSRLVPDLTRPMEPADRTFFDKVRLLSILQLLVDADGPIANQYAAEPDTEPVEVF